MDLKIGDRVEFAMHEDQPALKVEMAGTVVGLPTTDPFQGTAKVLVTEILTKDPKRRGSYRGFVGKTFWRPVAGMIVKGGL